MREFQFDPDSSIPTVTALVVGPKSPKKVRLVFDTGCAVTELHDRVMRHLGYSPDKATKKVDIRGVKGIIEVGELHTVHSLFVLGKKIENAPVVCMEMSDMVREGYDGLLGWNIIRQLRLEMDGPQGALKVY